MRRHSSTYVTTDKIIDLVCCTEKWSVKFCHTKTLNNRTHFSTLSKMPNFNNEPSELIPQANTSHYVYENGLGDKIFYTSLSYLLLIWIVLSNFALIMVLLKYPVTTPSNVVIRVSLAVSDMILSFNICFLIVYVFFSTTFHLGFCGVMIGIIMANAYVPFLTTAALAIERYFFFVKPLKYQRFLKPAVVICCLLLLYVALAIYLLVVGQIHGHQVTNSEIFFSSTKFGYFACHDQGSHSNDFVIDDNLDCVE